jgi:hypothetical protein
MFNEYARQCYTHCPLPSAEYRLYQGLVNFIYSKGVSILAL